MRERMYRRLQRAASVAALIFLMLGGQIFSTPWTSAADSSDAKKILDQWLQRQSSVRTWSADVLQIRHLKALSRPLETEGHVWFEQPNRFRWQLGDPPRTIAVRTRDALLIEYPRFKRVERFPLTGEMNSSWRYVMALLDVGFPSDPATFYASYDLESAEKIDDVWRFDLRPAAKEARRLLDSVRLEILPGDLTLKATELAFPDGSIMRNEFRNLQLNPDIKPGIFDLEIPKDYQVVNPLQK